MDDEVFLSYSHADRAYVESLARFLREIGVSVWFDERVSPGDAFGPVIQAALDGCRVFVPVLSPDAVTSRWVEREIHHADQQNKPIIPLLLAYCTVPLSLANLSYVDVTNRKMPGDAFLHQVGDHLGRRLAMASHRAIDEQPAGVRTVAFAPDGRHVATAGGDDFVRIWRVDSGELVRTLAGQAVAFASDGHVIGTAGRNGTAQLWRPDGRALRTLSGHGDDVETITFSPDGRLVATGGLDNTARLWRADTGENIHVLAGHTGWVWSASFSGDGRRLATGSLDGTVRLWDTTTGSLVGTLTEHTGPVWSVAYSRDGVLATAGQDQTVRVWGEEPRVLGGSLGDVHAVAWSHDGRRLASASGDRTVRVWEAASGRLKHSFAGHGGQVLSVTWSPDDHTLATVGRDRAVRFWRVR